MPSLSLRNIAFFSITSLALLSGVFSVAQLASAQVYPSYSGYPNYSQLQIVTQTQNGSSLSGSAATITVAASSASLGSTPGTYNSGSISFPTNFQNQSQVVTFLPGPYSVSASPISGYTFSYSPSCQGTISVGGPLTPCTITAYTSTPVAGQGVLTVYTNVNSFSSYVTSLPTGFSLSVTGNSPSPSSFQATSGGQTITLWPGAYQLATPPLPGWQVSQGANCSGYIESGQQVSCTVTYSYQGSTYYPSSSNYPSYPQNYYNSSSLQCLPSYQEVSVGQEASFTATGGSGTYNWVTPDQNYVGIGAVLNVALQSTGIENVVVSSGAQTATCTVAVVANGSVITPSYVLPTLPNTGFAPLSVTLEQNATAIAFALVVFTCLCVFAFPYARATLASFFG